MRPQEWWERRKKTFDRLMEARNVPLKRKEVAWRLCLGDSDKEIGQRFGLTRNGVASHVRLLFPPFGMHDRRSFRRTVADQMEAEPPRPAALSCVHTSFRFSMRRSTTTLVNDMGGPTRGERQSGDAKARFTVCVGPRPCSAGARRLRTGMRGRPCALELDEVGERHGANRHMA
jgi:hypothetical protein